MSPALSPDALLAKSKVYIQRGFRAHAAGDFEEYQLWASLALELLGKAALARIHPALIADPQHYQSLFAACGKPISPDVKTIIAKTLFLRLSHIERKFDIKCQEFCNQLSLRRNSELHSGESPFSGIKAEQWEQEFWGVIELVLQAQGQDLGSWLGEENAKAPSEIVKKARDAKRLAVLQRIKKAGESFVDNHKNRKERESLIKDSSALRYLDFREKFSLFGDMHSRETCPACRAEGFIIGVEWESEVVRDDLDDDYETVEITYGVEEFYCPVCELSLFGVNEIIAAEITDTFTERKSRVRQYEEEYMNE